MGDGLTAANRPWLPYVAPMAVFLTLTIANDKLSRIGGSFRPTWYAAGYLVKFGLVALAVYLSRSSWKDLAPWPKGGSVLLAAVLGLGVTTAWIALDGHYPVPSVLGVRAGLDPRMLPLGWKLVFLPVRLLGLVVLVPLLEELFWRSFILRTIMAAKFTSVPIGRVTLGAAFLTSILFALGHPEWLPALLTGLLWAWLLWRTKSLATCVISHAVANLGLGAWILATQSWQFW